MAKQKRATNERWKRIGGFIRDRRSDLGLSQGDIINALGYKNRASVSNIEVGIEGLPFRRIYAWADILEVPRDQFFRFVTGEVPRMEIGRKQPGPQPLNDDEGELLETYRRLPPRYRDRLREQARDFEKLSSSIKQQKRRRS